MLKKGKDSGRRDVVARIRGDGRDTHPSLAVRCQLLRAPWVPSIGGDRTACAGLAVLLKMRRLRLEPDVFAPAARGFHPDPASPPGVTGHHILQIWRDIPSYSGIWRDGHETAEIRGKRPLDGRIGGPNPVSANFGRLAA
jgi:hypothetical protein